MKQNNQHIGLRKRVIFPLIAIIVCTLFAGSYFVFLFENERLYSTIKHQSESMQQHLQAMLNARSETMMADLWFISQNPQILKALRTRDRQALLELSVPIYKYLNAEHNITHLYFHDAQRINLLRVHQPDRHADQINRYTTLQAEATLSVYSGIELGPLGTFTLRTVLPIIENNALQGYIELGQEIDELIHHTKNIFGFESYVLINKDLIVRDAWENGMKMLDRPYNWDQLSNAVLASQSLPNVPESLFEKVASWHPEQADVIQMDVMLNHRHFFVGVIPVHDAKETQVAKLVMLQDISDIDAHLYEVLLIVTGICLSIGFAIVYFFYHLLGRTEMELLKAQSDIERSLYVQRILDTILNISLSSLKLPEVLSRALDAILEIPSFSLLNKGSIFLVDADDNKTLDMVAQRNLPDTLLESCSKLPFGACLCGKTAVTREILFTNHIDDGHEIHYDGIKPHGHYCIPIMNENKLMGVLNIYTPSQHQSNLEERNYLKTVAATLAVVIERKRNEQALMQLAHHDVLTGLPNRQLFYDRLKQTLAWAQRRKETFMVFFIDLDHFKEINDSLGHDTGDKVLKETALRIQTCIKRKNDTIARMGGDEFILILPELRNKRHASLLAQRVIESISQRIKIDNKTYRLGCSIGIAQYPDHGEDKHSLIKHADDAMYAAKKQGNTYCFYSDPANVLLPQKQATINTVE